MKSQTIALVIAALCDAAVLVIAVHFAVKYW
jgi:hypothetical protein